MRTVAIVGASLAGYSAARALRAHGFDGRLVLIGAEPHRPYDRPPLSKEFLAGEAPPAQLALEAEDEELGAEWLLGSTADGLDIGARRVLLAGGRSVPADGVVIATGASARTLPAGHELAGVHTLRTLDDAVALRDDLRTAGRLVVIGGGFIGAEVASTARRLGLAVTVVEALPVPLAGPLGAQLGKVVSTLHADHGTRLLCGVGVNGLTGAPRVDGVRLDDGRWLPADVVVVGIGARPNIGWLASSGLAVGDGVLCGPTGGTSAAGVVAVGDCAAWYDLGLGAHHRVEHWTAARDQPEIAAATLLGGPDAAVAPARPHYFWSDQYGVRIQFAGQAGRADGVTIEEGDVESRSFLAVYRRDDCPVAVLGMNRSRSFVRWRRQLGRAAAGVRAAAGASGQGHQPGAAAIA